MLEDVHEEDHVDLRTEHAVVDAIHYAVLDVRQTTELTSQRVDGVGIDVRDDDAPDARR